MEKLDNNSAKLADELRQVILADRMAVEQVNSAYETKRAIEQKTAAEKQKILQEAEKTRQEILARVAEEQREELAHRKGKTAERYAGARQALQDEMEQNRQRWVDEITGAITGGVAG